jgi:hypothetical protein
VVRGNEVHPLAGGGRGRDGTNYHKQPAAPRAQRGVRCRVQKSAYVSIREHTSAYTSEG